MKKPKQTNVERLTEVFEGVFNELDDIMGYPRRGFDATLESELSMCADDFVGLVSKLKILRDASHVTRAMEIVLARCGSPIEKMLLTAIHFAATYNHGVDPVSVIEHSEIAQIPEDFNTTVKILSQFQVGPYRTDFLITRQSFDPGLDFPKTGTWINTQVLVECDGHDFHEKTKEQAAHDKKRDRFFQAQGHRVLRFTGSEIWKDPLAAADEILKLLDPERRA